MKAKEASTKPGQLLPNFIAGNLRLLRKRQGWSQSELAQKVNLNRGNIASYESGLAEPSICKLLRISNLFTVNTRDFTRTDFSEPGQLDMARQAQIEQLNKENGEIEQYRERAAELAELVYSSKKLFENKRSRIENPCEEADIFAAQYHQLYDVTQQLLQEHRALLGKVGCQCE
ncbi:MAG: transcriptional regulator with XRE-family HTH domain [Neolewinella sp.]|jgi:transcriptional regulator with XRE-family HTH domain